MIKVSIIIPVFNSAHLVGQTILSVLKQQYHDWEMIIVDDGSSDNITEVIEGYASQDERIRLFHQKNTGASAARNTGIKNSTNDWLLFLDADDWIREDYFEKMIPVLQNDPSIDVVHCGWTRMGNSGIISKENYGGEHSEMFHILAHHCPFAIHSCIVRKKIVEEVGCFDTSFTTCGDWDLWQRIARTGAKFQMVKETMAFYRSTPNSLSSDGNQFCLNGLQVISNAYAFDPRVQNPKHEYVNGLRAVDLVNRKYYFISWSAGLLIGALKPASHLLKHLKGSTAENLNPDFIAETLLDSVIIPAEKKETNWISHWNRIEDNLKKFLTDLEEQSKTKNLARQSCAFLERYVITHSVDHIEQQQIGRSFGEKINIEAPIEDKPLPGNVERFFGIIQIKNKTLGIIELQVTDSPLPAALIKDAIATKFSWQILQHFFSETVYPFIKTDRSIVNPQLSERDFHDRIGWEIFLQQLWQKPGCEESMFYEPLTTQQEKGIVIRADDEVHIEIGNDLPFIKTGNSTLRIIYYIGGTKAGVAFCEVQKNSVTPQMLRAAITVSSKHELCRMVVREALIGESLSNNMNLKDRLSKKMKKEAKSSK